MLWLGVRIAIAMATGGFLWFFGRVMGSFAPDQPQAARQAVGLGAVGAIAVFLGLTWAGDLWRWVVTHLILAIRR